jgi:hypothetical protein
VTRYSGSGRAWSPVQVRHQILSAQWAVPSLAVGVVQVVVDRPHPHHEAFRDLPIGQARHRSTRRNEVRRQAARPEIALDSAQRPDACSQERTDNGDRRRRRREPGRPLVDRRASPADQRVADTRPERLTVTLCSAIEPARSGTRGAGLLGVDCGYAGPDLRWSDGRRRGTATGRAGPRSVRQLRSSGHRAEPSLEKTRIHPRPARCSRSRASRNGASKPPTEESRPVS